MSPTRARVSRPACFTAPLRPAPRFKPDRACREQKKAALRARPFLFGAGRIPLAPLSGPSEIRLASGAQIVGRRLARATIRHDFVADLLAFTQCTKSGALDGADVHEHVIATVIRLNEAEALGCVKPLHGSHAHGIVPSQDRQYRSPLHDGLVRSNFWKGRQRLNRLYRWIANVVQPKIDKHYIIRSRPPKQC